MGYFNQRGHITRVQHAELSTGMRVFESLQPAEPSRAKAKPKPTFPGIAYMQYFHLIRQSEPQR